MDELDPLLVDTGRGFSLRYLGRWLYSARAPLEAPSRTVRDLAIQAETLYVLPSPCLWHGVSELLHRLPPSSALLGLEASDPLYRMAESHVPDGSRGRIMLAHPADALNAASALEASMHPARFRRVVEVRLSGGRALAADVYDAAIAALDADIAIRYRNKLAMVRMGRLWTRNVIANLASMRWSEVSPLPRDARPVVVCGAGPSLDDALPLLRTYRQGLNIIAVDTAAGALVRAGILPDMVLCLEAQIYNVADFLTTTRMRTRLVADLSAHPSSFRATDGPLTLLSSQWTQSAFLTRLHAAGLPITPVPPLGSVGVLALHVAKSSGSLIIITGLDFAFPPGRTHCAGSPADLAARRRESRTARNAAAWEASYRDHVRRLGNGGLVDPPLAMYAALAASELAGVQAYDMRGGYGAALPALALDESGLRRLIKDAAISIHQEPTTSVDPGLYRGRALEFLHAELERAIDVATALRSGCTAEELKAKLAASDFLYAHFPDPERVLALEHDALLRVAAEAAYWSGRLEAAVRTA